VRLQVAQLLKDVLSVVCRGDESLCAFHSDDSGGHQLQVSFVDTCLHLLKLSKVPAGVVEAPNGGAEASRTLFLYAYPFCERILPAKDLRLTELRLEQLVVAAVAVSWLLWSSLM